VGHPLVGLGDKHDHGLQDAFLGEGEQLQGIIQARRIAPALRNDGLQFLNLIAPDLGVHLGLSGSHPVAVSIKGVDLAVVTQHPKGLCQ